MITAKFSYSLLFRFTTFLVVALVVNFIIAVTLALVMTSESVPSKYYSVIVEPHALVLVVQKNDVWLCRVSDATWHVCLCVAVAAGPRHCRRPLSVPCASQQNVSVLRDAYSPGGSFRSA